MGRFVAVAMTALVLLACAITVIPGAGAGFADEGTAPSNELVGDVVNEQDHRLAVQAAGRALDATPDGTSVAWNNPDNGHTGSIAPTRTYEALGGAHCRAYESAVTIDGRLERASGIACKQSDGTWRPLKNR